MSAPYTSADFLKALYGTDELPTKFFAGHLVATRLDRVAEIIPEWHPLRATLTQVARIVRAGSEARESAVSLSRSDHGFVELRPFWALLIANQGRTGATPADSLRALALINLWERSSDGLARRVREINAFVKRWDNEPDSHTAFHLRTYLRLPHLGLDAAEAELATAIKTNDASNAARSAVRHLLMEADKHLVVVKLTRRNDPIANGARIRQSWIDQAPASIETGDGNRFLVSTINSVSARSRQLKRKTIQSAYLVQRSLISAANQTLTPKESKACITVLLKLIEEQQDPIANQSQAALIAVLAFLSSRGFRDLHADLERLPEGSAKHFEVSGSYATLVQAVPYREAFATVPNFEDSLTPLREARFPLPDVIGARLRLLADNAQRIISWDTFEAEFDQFRNRLKGATPRYCEGRSRMAFPSAAFRRCNGDTAIVQLLIGQELFQSSAPLAYFGMSMSAASKLWSDVVLKLSGLQCPVIAPGSAGEGWLGAPIAALPDRAFHNLTAAYREELARAVRSGSPIEIHNALVIYTARLFQACSAHRGHNNIGDLTFGAIEPRGLWVGADKARDDSPGIRAGILAPMVLDQILELFRYRQHLATTSHGPVKIACDAACSSDAPIFWLLNEGSQGRAVGTADIAPPSDSGLPVNVTRSRMRMLLTRASTLPRHIYSLLGHVWNSYAAFAQQTTESLADVAATLSPELQRHLLSDGWAFVPLPASKTARRAATLPFPSFARVTSNEALTTMTAGGGRPTTPSRFSVQRENEHDALVTSLLLPLERRASVDGAVCRDIEVTAAHVNDLVDGVLEAFGAEGARTEACLRMLRARIIWHRQRYAWTGVLPPIVVEPEPVAPPVTVQNMQAARLALVIREHFTGAMSFGGTIDSEARMLRTAALLILDRVVFDKRQLLDTIKEIARPVDSRPPHSMLPGFVEVPMAATRRTVATARELSILVHNLAGASVPTPLVMERRLRNELTKLLGHFKGSAIKRLFALATLASRIESPGVDWLVVDRKDHGTLSLSRTLDVIYDQCRGSFVDPNDTLLHHSVKLRQQVAAHPNDSFVRYRQYMDFRRSLHALIEPGAGRRGIPWGRFKRARALANTVIEAPTTDRVVVMLATFAFSFYSNIRTRRRLSTAYGAMVTIGRRLILALGEDELDSLDEDRLTALYRDVIDSAVKPSRREVAQALRRFHAYHTALLSPVNDSEAFQGYLDATECPVHATIVTHAEHQTCTRIYKQSADAGMLSAMASRDRCNALALMHSGALRAGEVTHARREDTFALDGESILFIHATSAGLVKTQAANRLAPLPYDWHREESASQEPGLPSPSSLNMRGPLLFPDARGRDLSLILDDLRETLAHCSGDPLISLHADRHAAISYALLELQGSSNSDVDPVIAYWQRSASFGHIEFPITRAHYWHLQHLLARPIPTSPLTAPRLSILTGVSGDKIRQDRSRSKRTPANQYSDAHGHRSTARFRAIHWDDRSLATATTRDPLVWAVRKADPSLNIYAICRFLSCVHRERSVVRARDYVALSVADLRDVLKRLDEVTTMFGISLLPNDLPDLGAVGHAASKSSLLRTRHVALSRTDRHAITALDICRPPNNPALAVAAFMGARTQATSLALDALDDVRRSIQWEGWNSAAAQTRENVLVCVAIAALAAEAIGANRVQVASLIR